FILFLLPYSSHLNEVYDSLIRFNLDVYSRYPAPMAELRTFLFGPWYLWLTALAGVILLKLNPTLNTIKKFPPSISIRYYFALLASLLLSPFLMRKYADYRLFPFFAMLLPLSAVALNEAYAMVRKFFSSHLRLQQFFPTMALMIVAACILRIMSRDP